MRIALAIIAAAALFSPVPASSSVLRLDREASTSTVAVTGRVGIVRNCGGRASTRMS
jgi:hypothetical protein